VPVTSGAVSRNRSAILNKRAVTADDVSVAGELAGKDARPGRARHHLCSTAAT
jgi:hypothetical protein